MVKWALRIFFLLIVPCSVSSLIISENEIAAAETTAKTNPAVENYLNAHLLASRSDLNNPDIVFIDVRTAEDYQAGHVPGAIHLWWKTLGYPDMLSIQQLETVLGQNGLSRNSKMVIYDQGTSSEGHAGRIFWILEFLGCEHLQVLNGGIAKWLADGKALEKRIKRLPPATFSAIPQRPILVHKNDILKRINDNNFVIIDSRTDEEYNGWPLHGVKRGGHIKNAISMNHKWFFNEDGTIRKASELNELMESLEITPNKELVSYGNAGIRSGTVYFVLRLMGYPRCANYEGSLLEWSSDSAMPMEAMPRYEKLVNASWVEELINGGNPGKAGQPLTYPGKGFVIVHASSLYWKGAANPKGYDAHGDYASGHIPGAISIPLQLFDTKQKEGIYPWTKPEDGNILPPDQLRAVIQDFGIKHDQTVVVYCGNKSYIGGAYRVAWALMYAGVEDVRYLNGDLAAWVENGGALETRFNKPRPVDDFGASVPRHPEYLVTTDQVKLMGSAKDSIVADDRSWTEYSATDKSGCYYDFFCRPGHVPGAVWVHDMYWYLDDFKSWRKPGYYKPATLKTYTLVKQEWEKLGITANKKIAFYCGGGWRSSLVWYYAYLMGYPTVTNYDGGWYDWTWDPTRPVAVGE